MKVKEIDRTANVAWSPSTQHPVYLAAATAAQQLDATFSTSAALEIYSLNLAENELQMPLVGSIPSEHRYYKILWGSHGIANSSCPAGIIIAGSETGSVLGYNASALISKEEVSPIFKQDKHTGSVKALDFNIFQPNLLASGACDSEIYIWDLNKPDTPMTPGSKSMPPEEVTCIAWNCQVQHILASTFSARCVVWDLRKNEPIIKISDSMSGMKTRLTAWSPDVATQLCLSSEDDHTPVIQLWDLRYATSPLNTFEKHQRGILSLAWCPQDPDLLLSCGKDNKILCWNPNTAAQGGEVVCELETSNQWSFDVQWCPRNPGIISSASFDGHVSVFSLMGGGNPSQPTNKVAESFNTNVLPDQSMAQTTPVIIPLQKPPKWLCKPVGATFGFGGKLISFEHVRGTVHPTQTPTAAQTQNQPRPVYISQVVTETDLLQRSNQLQNALNNNEIVEFCTMKAENCTDSMEQNIWLFLKSNFEEDPRSKFLQLLGYNKNELAKNVFEHVSSKEDQQGINAAELARKMSLLNTDSLVQGGGTLSGQASPSIGSKTPNSMGEPSEASSIFEDIALQQCNLSGSQSPQPIPAQSNLPSSARTPLTISTNADATGLLSQALLMGNFEAAVEMCLHENQMAEAILLAIAGGPDLLRRTQIKYFSTHHSSLSRLISSVVTHDWNHVIQTCNLENWKEALAVLITYASPEEFPFLCDLLGARLESDKESSVYASLCYICSGNVEKLVENWQQNSQNVNEPSALQDLVEKLMLLRKAVEFSQGQETPIKEGMVADKLSKYASILAAQGNLNTAMSYMNSFPGPALDSVKDRLFHALNGNLVGLQQPPFPFSKIEILPEGAKRNQQQHLQQQQQQQHHHHQQQQQRFHHHQQQAQPHQPKPYQVSQPQQVYEQGPQSFYQPNLQQNPAFPKQQEDQRVGLNSQQVQAISQFRTTTTPSSYFGQNQYPSTNGSVAEPQIPAYPTHMSSMMTPSTGTPMSKGPLAQKYRSHSGSSNPGYGMENFNQTPALNPDYSNHSSYQQQQQQQPPYSSLNSYPTSNNYHSQAQMQPHNVFNPATAPVSPQQPTGSMGDVPSFQEMKPHTPWNDPPLLKDKPNSKFESPAPITNQMYGIPSNTDQQQPTGAPLGNYPNIYNPQQHQAPVQQAPVVVNKAPEPAPEIVKGPLPNEHQILQDIFDALVENCLKVASNALTKRKLEDVVKKLDALYDKLRENALSQNIILGLHQIVQSLQQYDYDRGLQIYTHMISQGNFSEIGSFMPGLKVLMQTANNLQVQ
ncbi:protein transport protein Sec31A-like [Argonauta hians]